MAYFTKHTVILDETVALSHKRCVIVTVIETCKKSEKYGLEYIDIEKLLL